MTRDIRDDPRCSVDKHQGEGRIKVSPTSFYYEWSIYNNTKESIFIRDSLDNKIKFESNRGMIGIGEFIEVRISSTIGDRTFLHNRESSKTSFDTVRIGVDSLNDGPVYIPQIDLVLYTNHYESVAYHPKSEDYINQRIKRAVQQTIDSITEAPFVVLANDPEANYKNLFIELHGKICAVRVTHYKEEPAELKIMHRSVHKKDKSFFRTKAYTFSELEKASKVINVWDADGIIISPNINTLENFINNSKKQQDIDTLKLSEHKRIVSDIKDIHDEAMSMANDEITTLKNHIASLKRTIDYLSNNKFSVDQDRIEILEANLKKAEYEFKKAKYEFDKENIDKDNSRKTRDELIAAGTLLIKSMVVIVPAVFGIMKFVKTKK